MINILRISTSCLVILLLACGAARKDGTGDAADLDDTSGDWNTDNIPDVPDAVDGLDADGLDADGEDVERCYDEGCPCERGETVACYEGPEDTRGTGPCHDGLRICTEENIFSECIGQVLPGDEVCDGIDNDCDGEADEGVLNACGECGEVPDEICGNGLDDNCNGLVDEGCDCDAGCLCPDPPDPEAPCECHPPTDQPCYDGPPGTLGMGECRGGLHDCIIEVDGSGHWGPCEGQVLPSGECAGGPDGLDNDCDGMVDEGCVPDGDGDGYTVPEDCDDGNPDVNPGEEEICDGIDNNCNGLADEGVLNACGECGEVPEEICNNGFDDDCDGLIDENCACEAGETQACYSGPPETEGVGHCHAGTQECIAVGEFSRWGACEGESPPDLEICDGEDNDCDGEADERWAVGSNRCGFCDPTEICDFLDNDCDGFIDEGLRNACGDCLPVPEESVCDGLDDDCDGLIDEGLLNSCGECPPAPCYEEPYPDPGECDDPGRDCDGTVPWPDDPTSITLGQSTLSNPFIYIAVTNRNQVAKLNTETGAKVWQVPSHGTWPSRTAVALDYTVWVGNRGFGNVWDASASNVVHLDLDGNLICRADVTGLARGVAIDGDGNVWGGTWDGRTVWKIDGSAVDAMQDPPRCIIHGSWDVGTSIYGLAVDGEGYLWSASGNSHSHTTDNAIKFNTRADTWVYVTNPSWYGVAVSPLTGKIWYGSWWGSGCVHSIDPNPPYTVFDTSVGCGGSITGVTVDIDGFVWASSYSDNIVYKIDPVTGTEVCSVPINTPSGSDARGVAMDAAGKIWCAHRLGGYANRFLRSDCSLDGTFEVDAGYETYTYSDMTGMQLRTVTVREGHWIQNYDSGYACPDWHHVEWIADVPPDTFVSVTAVAADTEAQLTTAPSAPCGPFTSSPGDLLSCTQLQCHRWLQLDVMLTTTRDAVRPVVHDISVFWSY